MQKAWYLDHLACPDCQADLEWREGAQCMCGFAAAADGRDLRPQRPRARTQTYSLGSPVTDVLPSLSLGRPEITYRGPATIRDSRELFSAVESRLRRGARLLDLGCGPRDQAAAAGHYGLDYVGIDFDSAQADLLADGHALPFRPATFDAVLSYAVLEHLYNPFLALAEVRRVVKPGGVYFGTVSQGEPFHESYFHHTTYGVIAAFTAAGLRVERLWPSYDTLHSLSGMGRYPRAQRLLIEAVYRFGRAFPILAPRRFFRWSAREKELDELHRAAGICFVATPDV